MDKLDRSLTEDWPADQWLAEDSIEGQITLWTRVVCGLMIVGLWLCAASLYLAMHDV